MRDLADVAETTPVTSMKQQLTIAEVLTWCDAFHAKHGRWPRQEDGPIRQADLTWCALSLLLRSRGRNNLVNFVGEV